MWCYKYGFLIYWKCKILDVTNLESKFQCSFLSDFVKAMLKKFQEDSMVGYFRIEKCLNVYIVWI